MKLHKTYAAAVLQSPRLTGPINRCQVLRGVIFRLDYAGLGFGRRLAGR